MSITDIRSLLISNINLFTFIILFILSASGLSWFILSPELSSFTNDSANYLFMARYFSDYHSLSPRFDGVYSTQVFPPFFPLLLAVAGVSDSVWGSHLIVLLHLLAFYVLLFLYLRRGSDKISLRIVVMVMAMFTPGVWVGSLGVLSEDIFVCYAMLLFYVWESGILLRKANGVYQYVSLSLLMAIIPLVRSIGFVVIPAYLLCEGLRYRRRQVSAGLLVVPPLVAFLFYMMWGAIGPSHSQGYFRVMGWLLVSTFVPGDSLTLWDVVIRNGVSFYHQWLEFFGVSGSQSIRVLFPLIILVLIIISTIHQAFNLKLHAWFLFFYMAGVMAWPIAEWYRLTLPFFLLSLPVIADFIASTDIKQQSISFRHKINRSKILNTALLITVIFTLIQQSSLIAQARDYKAKDERVANVYELYRKGGKHSSFAKAKATRDLLDDYKKIAWLKGEDVLVYAVKPTFLAYLSHVPTKQLYAIRKIEDICQFRQVENAYILVSPLRIGYNVQGMKIIEGIRSFSTAVWSNRNSDINENKKLTTLVLFKIDEEKLRKKIQQNNLNCQTWIPPL